MFVCVEDQREKGDKVEAEANTFYILIYFFLMSDFFVRIYPPLLFAVVVPEYGYFVLILVLYALLEFPMYYYMQKDRSLCQTFKYFAIGLFSCSFWFLSTMYLSYLQCNVDYNRLMVEQITRLFVQLFLLLLVLYLQYSAYDDDFSWSHVGLLSAIIFPVTWILNASMMYPIYHYMKSSFKIKIEQA